MAALAYYDKIMACLTLKGKKQILTQIGEGGYKLNKDGVNAFLKSLAIASKITAKIITDAAGVIENRSSVIKSGTGEYIKSGKVEEWNTFVAEVDNFAKDFNEDEKNLAFSPKRANDRDDYDHFSPSPRKKNPDLGHNRSPVVRRLEDDMLDAEPTDNKYLKYDPELDLEMSIRDQILFDLARDDDKDEDMGSAAGGDPYGGQLCPSCVTGLCDTHVQLRF